MLMARSGHTAVRSLARYARLSAEVLQRHQAPDQRKVFLIEIPAELLLAAVRAPGEATR